MSEGEILKQFIDNQAKSKISIARDLKITKQSLFQYFKSKLLAPETKAKLENYFGKEIFTSQYNRTEEPEAPYERKSHENVSPESENVVVELLKSQIKMLENHCAFVQKMYEDMKNKTDANLLIALDNQRVMMRQIAVQAHVTAERFAGNDKKKFQQELDKIDRLMTAGM
jgi:hypothetical protein